MIFLNNEHVLARPLGRVPGSRGGVVIPEITGIPYPGETLTSNVPTQWTRNGVDVGPPNATTYSVGLVDASLQIRAGNSDPVFVDYDLDAALWLLDVQAAGGNVTQPRINAADVFYKAEKAPGRYALLQRMYLPIWGVAAANAISLKVRAIGSYVGGFTYGAGFTQSTGGTGYFVTGADVAGLGMSAGNAYLAALTIQNPSIAGGQTLMGTPFVAIRNNTSSSMQARIGGTNTNYPGGIQTGIISMSATATNQRLLRVRRQSGIVSEVINTTATTGGISGDLRAHGREDGQEVHPGHFGYFAYGLGMSAADDSAHTANVKTFWEACTGLTLPS